MPGVVSCSADITTQRCLDLIRGQIKHLKADVVLNDGAPNVGADWNKDAYMQSELVMHSLKLATQVLRKGGFFISKIFRSTDFMNLMWLFNKFFEAVEVSKPEASRNQSAEIFVVCSRYRAPDSIDPRFFEPKWVFKNSEGDFLREMADNNVNSIRKVFEEKRRNIFRDDAPGNLFKRVGIRDFVFGDNPYAVFAEFNQIDTAEDWAEAPLEGREGVRFGELVAFPEDFKEACQDLKLVSKAQVAAMVRWRAKVLQALKRWRARLAQAQAEEGMEEWRRRTPRTTETGSTVRPKRKKSPGKSQGKAAIQVREEQGCGQRGHRRRTRRGRPGRLRVHQVPGTGSEGGVPGGGRARGATGVQEEEAGLLCRDVRQHRVLVRATHAEGDGQAG